MAPRGATGLSVSYANSITPSSRRERGLLLPSLTKVTGYSPAQIKRLLKQFRTERHLCGRRRPPAKPFAYRHSMAVSKRTG